MVTDVIQLVGAVARRVEGVERDGRPAWLITAVRRYDTSVEDLWDALTNPDRIPRWFLPVTGDLRVGGRYQTEGNAGGEVLACDPPRSFRLTWELGDDCSWVTVTLTASAAGGGTELELRHLAHVPEEFWDQFGPGAVGVGWELALLGLHLHLAQGGAAVDPAEVEAWTGSPEGVAFISGVSGAWGAASIVAGVDAAAATAAADRTTAFYTGTPPDGDGGHGDGGHGDGDADPAASA